MRFSIHRTFFVVAFFIILFSGCESLSVGDQKSTRVFRPDLYFKDEAAKLSRQNIILEKTLIKDGVVEKQIADSINWNDEFRPFIQLDISKPAMINSYKVDTVITKFGYEIHYNATDSAASVRAMSVYFNEDTLVKLNAISATNNVYYYATDTLEYFGNGYYRIHASSMPKLGKDLSFELTGKPVN